MGTRGLWGFIDNETEYLTYNHFDSYPEGLGAAIIQFVNNTSVDEMRGAVRNLTIVPDAQATPTPDEWDKLSYYSNTSVSTGEDWYSLLRETQGNPALTLESGFIIDGSDFASDSLFCEWGYVINLDTEELEVYEGFQHDPHTEGRFASRTGREGYAPIKLIGTWPLNSLPTIAQIIAKSKYAEDDE